MDQEKPLQPEVRDPMLTLADLVDGMLNPGGKPKRWAFALLVFPFGEGAGPDRRANYVSNGQRADMLAAMKEFIARSEGRLIDRETQQ